MSFHLISSIDLKIDASRPSSCWAAVERAAGPVCNGPLPCACIPTHDKIAPHNKTHNKHFCTIKVFVIAFHIEEYLGPLGGFW
jgi:hypothetical protein